EGEDGSPSGRRINLDRSLVIVHDAVGDGQAEPGALGLRRVEGIEDAGQDIGRDAGARVAHHQPNRWVAARDDLRLERDLTSAVQGVAGVGHEIHHYLLERVNLSVNRRKTREEGPTYDDVGLGQLFLEEKERVLHDLVEIDASPLAGRLPGEGEQAVGDAGDP